MYTRIVTFTGATDVDGGIRYTRETVTPILKQQNGFRGITASADRAGGVLGALTVWETEAERDASESALTKVREEGLAIIGGTVTVETFEEVYAEIVALPSIGSSLLVRRISMDPSVVEENLEFFQREVLPQIKANPGFLAIRQQINRATGDGVVGTVWADPAALEAAAAAAEARRAAAAGQRVTFGEQSKREIVFIDLAR